jgi:hypothetical protein
MRRSHGILFVALALASCRPAPPPVLRSPVAHIVLRQLPTAGGNAFVDFDRFGVIQGGRLGPESTAVMREDHGQLPPDTAAAFVAAAEALRDSLQPDAPTDSMRSGMMHLVIVARDGSERHHSWPMAGQAARADVRALVARLMAHRPGAW